MATRDPVVEEPMHNGGSKGEGGPGLKKTRLEATSSISLDVRKEDIGKLSS